MKKTTDKPLKPANIKAPPIKAAATPTKKKPRPLTQKPINCQLPGAGLLAEGKSVAEVMAALEGEKEGANDLSLSHDLFCREYVHNNGNGVRAYMRAYPNSGYEGAKTGAGRLLTNADISARITGLTEERNNRLQIKPGKVLRRLEARSSFNIRDLHDADGGLIPIHLLPPDVSIGIKSIEVVELFAGQGENKVAIGLLRKITCFDGRASDELLGRHLKLWKDVGSDQNPLTLNPIKDLLDSVDGTTKDLVKP